MLAHKGGEHEAPGATILAPAYEATPAQPNAPRGRGKERHAGFASVALRRATPTPRHHAAMPCYAERGAVYRTGHRGLATQGPLGGAIGYAVMLRSL